MGPQSTCPLYKYITIAMVPPSHVAEIGISNSDKFDIYQDTSLDKQSFKGRINL